MDLQLRTTARGSALFLILIAVALFAALSYAVTQSGRGGGDTSKEKDALTAAQIVQYAGEIERAITRMRVINRCSDTQISFTSDHDRDGDYTDDDDGYYNPTAPADFSCHIFRPEGGGVQFRAFLNEPIWDTTGYWYAQRKVLLNGEYIVPGFGRSTDYDSLSNDLILIWIGLTKGICERLNNAILGTTDIETGFSFSHVAFKGTYLAVAMSAPLSNTYSKCISNTPGYYYFYSIVLAR